MSVSIPANIILEKNKLFSSGSFIELLEWQVSETSATVRIANHNEDVTWDRRTWTKFRFEGGGESDTGGDSAETLEIKVSAIDRVIQTRLETLTAGGIGDTVIYRRVSTEYLSLGAALTATFEIVDIDAGPDSEWVTFSLGQQNFFLSQFPANVFRRNICRYRPTLTSVCSYVNNVLCDRTFGSCVHFGQTAVFGGQPGIPGGAFNIPTSWSLKGTMVLDAILVLGYGSSSTGLDAVLNGEVTSTASLDALLLEASKTVTAALDALLVDTSTYASPQLDALLQKAQSSATALEGQIFEAKTLTASFDALVYEAQGSTVSLDAKLLGEVTSTTVLNAELLKTAQTITTVIDALLYEGGQSSSVELDALLIKAQSSISSLDTLLLEAKSITASLDALIYEVKSSTVSLDAKLLGEVTSTTALDAILLEVATEATTSLDAILVPGAGSIQAVLDGLLYESLTLSTGLDAILTDEGILDTGDSPMEDTAGNVIEDTRA